MQASKDTKRAHVAKKGKIVELLIKDRVDGIVVEDSVTHGMAEQLNPSLSLVDKEMRRNGNIERLISKPQSNIIMGGGCCKK